MSEYQNLLFEKKNQIAYITLNRPKVLNALNMAVVDELRRAERSVSYQARSGKKGSPKYESTTRAVSRNIGHTSHGIP